MPLFSRFSSLLVGVVVPMVVRVGDRFAEKFHDKKQLMLPSSEKLVFVRDN